MTNSAENILITGRPGIGKTTLIQRVAHELREYKPVGFSTVEIRSNSIRKGFTIASLDQKRTGTLAHVDVKGSHRVGKYGVDLPGFEQFLEESLPLFDPSPQLVIMDEIGKMECLSMKFRNLVVSLLDGPVPVIATIAMKAGGFIDQVKRRPDVRIYELTEGNRESLLSEIAGIVRASLD